MNCTNDWRDYTDSKTDIMEALANIPQDVMIIVGSANLQTIFKAHSFLLILYSDVFKKLLETANVINVNNEEINFPDVSAEALRFVLKHIYTCCTNMEDEEVVDILYVSLKLNLPHLTKFCVSKLRREISVQNVQHIFEKAMKMNEKELVQASKAFILKNARDVFAREEFLNIRREHLRDFVASDELKIDEVSLFKVVLSWGEARCRHLGLEKSKHNLLLVLGTVLPLIRFTLMTTDQFLNVVVPTNVLGFEKEIEVRKYLLRVINSDVNINIEPPQWIYSSASRASIN